jgi:RND family efflux transporter MFP subunit
MAVKAMLKTCFSSMAFLVAAALLEGCGVRAAPDARTEPPLVRLAQVGQPIPALMSFSGIVSAKVQSDLGFRVAGKVTARLVDTGQAVRRGQPLMQIDRTNFALATLAQAAAVDAARARATQARADEARYRDLVAAGAVSAMTYDQAKASADAAEALLAAAEAQVKVTQNETGYSVLMADADGIVVQALAEPGQVVAAGQTVVRLAHDGPREATVYLPETLRPSIGSRAKAVVFGTQVQSGATLRQLSHSADALTRTFDARYVLDESAGSVPLGATVTLLIPAGEKTALLQIPLSALFDDGRGPGVWILNASASTVAWHAVEVTSVSEETAAVADGIKPGESFVALGAHQLHEGEKVRVTLLADNAP